MYISIYLYISLYIYIYVYIYIYELLCISNKIYTSISILRIKTIKQILRILADVPTHARTHTHTLTLHPVSITRFPLTRFSPGSGLLRNPW